MNREDIRKLLGGYATGTLTPEEQQALFAAALEDQELFDALAREQSLRDLLRDPSVKAQALAALDQPKAGWLTRWWRPAALAATTAAVGVLVFVSMQQKIRIANTELVATVREQPRVAPPEVAQPPAPAEAAKTAPPRANTEKRAASALRREAKPRVAKEVDNALRDSASAGIAGAPAAATLSLPAATPTPQPATAPPPPPPAAVAETKALGKLESGSTASTVSVSAESVNIEVLKGKAADLTVRDMFQQNIVMTNQFLSKDGSAVAVQQSQSAPAPQQQQQGEFRQKAAGQGGFGAAQVLRAAFPPAGPVGVRYTIVPGGDAPSIRFELNAVGHISVWARARAGVWRVVQSSAAGVLIPVVVKLAAGEKEVAVWFSRDPNARAPQEPPPAIGPTSARTEGPRGGDAANYAVNPNVGANEVRFNITVN